LATERSSQSPRKNDAQCAASADWALRADRVHGDGLAVMRCPLNFSCALESIHRCIETTPLDHPPTEAGDAMALEGQKRVLAMLATGRPADDILAELLPWRGGAQSRRERRHSRLNRERKCLDRAIAPSAPLAFAAALSNSLGPPHLGT
jgi:hypothetical protein